MKIRNGFVSNSSSSSFVIFGLTVDENKSNLILDFLYSKAKEKYLEEKIDYIDNLYKEESLYELYEKVCVKTNLTLIYNEEVGKYIIGIGKIYDENSGIGELDINMVIKEYEDLLSDFNLYNKKPKFLYGTYRC